MGTYTIGEVAARSGVPATALRYYEGIGLVPPAGRTDAGYRLYDDTTLSRLAFIARAKQLGCSLEEIGDLVEIWDGDRCAPVQHRLHELVAGKLHDTDLRIAELAVFAGQLRSAAGQLAGDAMDGPCGDDCACMGSDVDARDDADAVVTVGIALGPKPAAAPPIACTLGAADMPGRLADWARLLAPARRRVALATGGVRVEFDHDVDVAALAGLAAAEQRCCAFFRFAVTVDTRGVGLEVDAPQEAAELVMALVGSPS